MCPAIDFKECKQIAITHRDNIIIKVLAMLQILFINARLVSERFRFKQCHHLFQLLFLVIHRGIT
ncbi:Uncharacterised protein [Klebsiella quasipneumoniae]|nr:Uncharacterised protein [Klebsiella quasipneumoniae]